MFKKKPNIKPLAPVKSSERRKQADAIIEAYGLSSPVQADATDEEKAQATSRHIELRNALLPDNIQSARFTTTQGPDLKQVSGTLYVGAHPGEDSRVLWFKYEDTLYPSVYTLWQNPGILPLLHTPEIVVKKIQGGADLMTPGLAGPPFPPRATKGSAVAIASLDSPSVPKAVGTCLVDIASLKTTQGAKGHAVETVHWAGDELWSFSTTNKPGKAPPSDLHGWLEEEDDHDAELAANVDAGLYLDDNEDGGVNLHQTSLAKQGADPNATPVRASVEQEEEQDAVSDRKPLTTKEIDKAFHDAFLYGIHHHKTTSPSAPNHGLEFPLTRSFVMSNLIQPFLPIFSPEDAKQLQIKNTSFKNLKKFIKSLEKEMLVKAKERPNDTWIVDVDFHDEQIKSFKPYRLPKKETVGGASQGRGTTATSTTESGDPSIGQTLHVSTFYKPPERILSILASAEPQHAQLYTASELKSATTSYLESGNLVSSTNKRLITLNPTLANALFTGTHPLDKEVLAKGSVARDALIDRVVSSCQPYYSIGSSRQSSSESKPKSGTLPKVKITLETRSGNKTVTKISGLERFSISAQLLADELRKTCAGSTSVEPLAGASPKDKERAMEVMVQGPQREAVIKALGRRGVVERWVEVTDKTKRKR